MKKIKTNISSERLNIFILILSLFFALTLCEISLRVFMKPSFQYPPRPKGWAIIPERSFMEYHSTLGWFHKKNQQSVLSMQGIQIPITTNSKGWRGSREYQIQKPQEVHRLYAVGDSFTFGFGVHNQETFTAKMETSAPHLEVLNLGVAGYAVDQMYLLLKEIGFDYRPDEVVITLFPEDFWRCLRAFNDAGNGKPYYSLSANGLELHHVPVPADKKFKVPQFPEVLPLQGWEKVLSNFAIGRLLLKSGVLIRKKMGIEDPDSSPEWLLGREILRQMIALIRQNQAKPVIVLAPPKRWITGTSEPIRESLKRFCEKENILLIDLTDDFRTAASQATPGDYYILNDNHWTSKGHELVSKILLDKLGLS